VALVLPFPRIDPVLIEIGPFAIRWYALAYIAGILAGWRYAVSLLRRPPKFLAPEALDDFLLWATVGVVLGGRLGYVLFYKPFTYLSHPLQIFYVWTGGMSFHGGMIGVSLAIILFAGRRQIPLFQFSDVIACVAPIGLFFGRLANFVNAELWGRETDMPWAMIFPTDPSQLPRHPSQLYQAALEGLLLFATLTILERRGVRQKPGVLTGVFLAGYGIARSTGELFREPDAFLGFIFGGVTMGQILSAPMIAAGVWLILRGRRRDAA
jgi:phosphatidylglycerol:prolipoprotein diacylglycerol transferase